MELSTDCAYASGVNMFKNRIEKYLVKAGYTYIPVKSSEAKQ